MRLFEAAAAGALIIADELPFARRAFGDAALYIDRSLPESPAHQIARHVAWARSNPQAAREMADAAYAIFSGSLCLEALLGPLPDFLREVRRQGGFDLEARAADAPQVDYVMRLGSRPLEFPARALGSLAAQSYPNIGLVLVEHGEVPGLEDILAGHAGRFRSIRRIDLRGVRGRSASLWAGLSAADAPFVANLDDDDFLASNHVASAMMTLARNPDIGFVSTGYVRIQEGGEDYTWQPNFQGALGKTVTERREMWFMTPQARAALWEGENLIGSAAWIARRDYFDSAVLEDPGLDWLEDIYLYRLLSLKTGFAFTWAPTAYWAIRPGDNASHDVAARKAAYDRLNLRLGPLAPAKGLSREQRHVLALLTGFGTALLHPGKSLARLPRKMANAWRIWRQEGWKGIRRRLTGTR
jgi:phosphoglycerol transferase